jgi:hypothetical protein
VPGIALHRFHEVGDQVVASLELHINICPGSIRLDPQLGKSVVENDNTQQKPSDRGQAQKQCLHRPRQSSTHHKQADRAVHSLAGPMAR